jgi:hypothetical protein
VVRSDIERGVPEALNLGDLRCGLEAIAPVGLVNPEHSEIDLVVLWVWVNYGGRWPVALRDSEALRPVVDGSIVATIQAIDLAMGRDPSGRMLEPRHRNWLEAWERHCRTEQG